MGTDIGLINERVTPGIDSASIRGRGCSVAAVMEALGRSTPADVASRFQIEPADILAALAWSGLGPESSPRLALVHENPRERALRPSLMEPAWAEVFPGSPRPARLALAAGLLQILDFWDESHEAAQSADDLGEHSLSPYWHGIAHRREPDPGNAAYWFRRVGRHPVFQDLGRRASGLLDAEGDSRLKSQLLKNGWDPYAMIELCTQAGSNENLARRLQRLELSLLFEATTRPLITLRS